MSYPTQLSFSAVNSGAALTVPKGTDVIIGLFFGIPAATLGGVAPSHSVTYGSILTIGSWNGKLVGTGAKTLSGGVKGYFYCLKNANFVPVSTGTGYSSSGSLVLNRTSTPKSTVFAIGKSSASAVAISETSVATFTYTYAGAGSKVGHRNASGLTFSTRISDGSSGAQTYGCVMIIDWVPPPSGVSVSNMSDFMML